jgi:hypothetical protein
MVYEPSSVPSVGDVWLPDADSEAVGTGTAVEVDGFEEPDAVDPGAAWLPCDTRTQVSKVIKTAQTPATIIQKELDRSRIPLGRSLFSFIGSPPKSLRVGHTFLDPPPFSYT